MALLTSVAAESEMLVTVLVPNRAVSLDPFGMVAGVQLVVLFQFPCVGLAFQVALPAWPFWIVNNPSTIVGKTTAKTE